MTQPTTLAQMQTSAVAKPKTDMPMSFLTSGGFDQLLRVSNMLSSSTMVPVAYRAHKEIKKGGQVTGYEKNSAGLANCAVALNMAQRMNADPLMIMQNLHIIEGRPSWSSAFIIASINSCGRYSSLRFVLSEPGEAIEVPYKVTEWVPGSNGKNRPQEVTKTIKVRHQTCMAWAIEKETGERLESPVVSIQMALDEGWLTKKGSKWQTIPELMLRYRCASFFGRLYAPELLMGLQSAEEVHDFIDAKPDGSGNFTVSLDDLQNQAAPPIPDQDDDEVTDAEIVPDAREADTKPAETATDQAESATAGADLPDDLAFE
ncbi:recombinase RecT [Pseudomonas protegens]|uniref:recombinase RecT n=1 Tax=Pseudomonas protegens TaxID=380021 RepID=UPI001C6A77D0|nr:recombinase RecT [Pseudomonas protegens]QYM99538.1 recombinase RecT [Pseudomonas protegens]